MLIDPSNHFICLLIDDFMDGGELQLGVVSMILDRNLKLNLTNLQHHKCNKKIILGQKVKANRKITMGRRVYNFVDFFFTKKLHKSSFISMVEFHQNYSMQMRNYTCYKNWSGKHELCSNTYGPLKRVNL